MNHTGVTRCCERCERIASVIMSRRHLCSRHALEATLDRLAVTVDLRSEDLELTIGGSDDALVRRIAV